MATAQECRKALERLTGRLYDEDVRARTAKLSEKSLSCRVPDLGITFMTRIRPDGADPIVESADGSSSAQIRFTANSDEVVAIGQRPATFATAWLTGRLKVEASFSDLLQLRKML
jgi:hypothetical protein